MKKGFTLIELLAVIIILAIVALIATPIVLNVIEDAKLSAGESETNIIIGGINNYCEQEKFKASLDPNYVSKCKQGMSVDDAKKLVNLGKSDIKEITYDGKKVTHMVIESNNHIFCLNDGVLKKDSECEKNVVVNTGTIKDIVLTNFPYLEKDEKGCKNDGPNNYSYMGGCYLKGLGNDPVDVFARNFDVNVDYSYNDEFTIEEIKTKFFNQDGSFNDTEYTNYMISIGIFYEDDLLNPDGTTNTAFELYYEMSSEEYFKQKVLNNSIWYSGFLWRIMGINKDGTIRMITDENVTAIPWGTTDSAQDWNNSHAKDWLNSYFYSKLKGNDIIVPQQFCSETVTDTAQLKECSEDRKFSSNVGLMTIDEYYLAGHMNSYLNIGQDSWTMTPYDASAAWILGSGGSAYDYVNVSSTYGLRAVINVNSNTTITSGNGTLGKIWNKETGPYVLNEDKNVEVKGTLVDKTTVGEYVELEGHKYRVVNKTDKGIKLILDGYYEEPVGTLFEMTYGTNNVFTLDSGIGKKLNTDVLTYLGLNTDEQKNKLATEYEWYQAEFDYGQNYTNAFANKNKVNEQQKQVLVGLPTIGEVLSSQSSSILTKGYTVVSSYMNTYWYWTMNPYQTYNSSSAWDVSNDGYAINDGVSNASGLRAVIVVKSDTTITGGNGTWYNPYKIKH